MNHGIYLRKEALVVGCGCFGLSTAYHLLQREYAVTIIDRAAELPASDAASTDLNKIVRSSYSDIAYTRLAREAIAEWKRRDVWGDAYRESGVLVIGKRTAKTSYSEVSLQNDIVVGAKVQLLPDGESIRASFPQDVPIGTHEDAFGYWNADGGWAYATAGIKTMMEKVRSLGGTILADQVVDGLVYGADGQVEGVSLASGKRITAKLIIVATGSWTPSIFSSPNLGVSERFLATGQSIATIRLTEEEAQIYRKCPVILDFRTGFYMFPPNDDNIVKLALHGPGYINPTSLKGTESLISTPRTVLSHANGAAIPKEMVTVLRNYLREFYPDLAKRPFEGTRLCWYSDTPDSDWVIDFHPDHSRLFFATGGSGHAYKFLPVLGRVVADRIEGKLEQSLAEKFAFNRNFGEKDMSRLQHDAQVLDETSLCTAATLQPPV